MATPGTPRRRHDRPGHPDWRRVDRDSWPARRRRARASARKMLGPLPRPARPRAAQVTLPDPGYAASSTLRAAPRSDCSSRHPSRSRGIWNTAAGARHPEPTRHPPLSSEIWAIRILDMVDPVDRTRELDIPTTAKTSERSHYDTDGGYYDSVIIGCQAAPGPHVAAGLLARCATTPGAPHAIALTSANGVADVPADDPGAPPIRRYGSTRAHPDRRWTVGRGHAAAEGLRRRP
jgi:hypothetical protein